MSYSGFNIPKREDKTTFSSRKKYKISLSLTDEDNYAVAFVTISS